MVWAVPTCTPSYGGIGSRKFCNFSNLQGPRQRLVEKRLSPRSPNVDYLLFRMSCEKNGWGQCCRSGPSRRARQVTAESAPVNFCHFSNPRNLRSPPASGWNGCLFSITDEFEKNGWGKCGGPGPSRHAQQVTAESAPVNFQCLKTAKSKMGRMLIICYCG